ncbi:E3 ubiquitin-protein ligase At3g02290 isoform X2 [Coffea arabica]|uniref:RING-type E3 ubiquitin transferase n=1 Tax=Coffea arabica TaxID=13443 RepID=A0A6P6UXL7_COFAR|nr:E3 ubiquitin-protein ligase At3g02290 isoform X2 [Coffea arabica]
MKMRTARTMETALASIAVYKALGIRNWRRRKGWWRQRVGRGYGALFARGSGLPALISNQGATSPDPVVPTHSSAITRASDRTLQMNPNSGYSPVPQDVICRHDKGSNHSRVEPEPAGDPEVQQTPRPSKVGDRLVYNQSESSVKDFSSSMQKGVGYDVTFSEDEDACPTCLEEYTLENPKIITKCFHHYHLSCIYEWLERSDTCPVCGMLMEFNET